jgi:hypothetical protein
LKAKGFGCGSNSTAFALSAYKTLREKKKKREITFLENQN